MLYYFNFVDGLGIRYIRDNIVATAYVFKSNENPEG